MTWRPSPRFFLALVLVATFGGAAWSQQHSSAPARTQEQPKSEPEKQAHPERGVAAAPEKESRAEAELAEASREAAGEDETAEFKQSATVRWLARVTGLKPFTAYWVFVVLNFVIIAALLAALMKSKVPAAFRARTESSKSVTGISSTCPKRPAIS